MRSAQNTSCDYTNTDRHLNYADVDHNGARRLKEDVMDALTFKGRPVLSFPMPILLMFYRERCPSRTTPMQHIIKT